MKFEKPHQFAWIEWESGITNARNNFVLDVLMNEFHMSEAFLPNPPLSLEPVAAVLGKRKKFLFYPLKIQNNN